MKGRRKGVLLGGLGRDEVSMPSVCLNSGRG